MERPIELPPSSQAGNRYTSESVCADQNAPIQVWAHAVGGPLVGPNQARVGGVVHVRPRQRGHWPVLVPAVFTVAGEFLEYMWRPVVVDNAEVEAALVTYS